MSFQFSQNNQTNFNNKTTEKDPYPSWLPYYTVKGGDSWWGIAKNLYPDLADNQITAKAEELAKLNGKKITDHLAVGEVLINPKFEKGLQKLKKNTFSVLSGKEDKKKNKAADIMKPKPKEAQAKKTGSDTAGSAVKNMKGKEEEDGMFDKFDKFMKSDGVLKDVDNWLESKKGKGGGTQKEGVIVFDEGAKFDGQDAHLAKAEHLWGRMDWGALSLMQMALGIEMPELQMTRSSSSWSGSKSATTFNTLKGYKEDIDAADEEQKQREEEAKKDEELSQGLKTMLKLYEELKPLGYGLQNLECSFPSENIKEFDKGEKVQNFEQVKAFIEKNSVFILDIQFRNLELKDGSKTIVAGHLSTPVMIKILKAIKAKKGALTLTEYNKIINQ